MLDSRKSYWRSQVLAVSNISEAQADRRDLTGYNSNDFANVSTSHGEIAIDEEQDGCFSGISILMALSKGQSVCVESFTTI